VIKEENIKEIKRLEMQISKCEANLSNDHFLKNAPANIILKEKQKKNDFEAILKTIKKNIESEEIKEVNDNKKVLGTFQVKDTLFTVILPNKYQDAYDFLIKKFETSEKVNWHIEYLREKKNIFQEYSKEWFDYIYNEDIKEDEIIKLYNIFKNDASKI